MSARIKLLRWFGAAIVTLAVVPWLGGSTAAATAEPAGTEHVKVASLTDHECNADEWHFIINQIDTEAHAPASITVTFSDDSTVVVPLEKFTGGAAHYTTTANLDLTVKDATAVLYDGWSGQFVLSHGPCPGTQTPTPSPSTSTATVTNTVTDTDTSTATNTVTNTATDTDTVTNTATDTDTATNTVTESESESVSDTTSVLPTKIGNTPSSDTGVLGTKTGVLAATGLDLPLGAALGLSLALLFFGGALMVVPSRVANPRHRRH